MGAARPRRWRLPFQRSAPSSPSSKSSAVPYSPARSAAAAENEIKWEQQQEAAPPELVCPILGALMADPVILPSGHTYERACLQACADLSFFPPGAGSGSDAMIPNSALKAAIGTWCARSGRVAPRPPSREAARAAVLRAMPPPPPAPAAAAEAKSVRTRRAATASSSNSSYSSPPSAASTSTYTSSSSEITPAEDDAAQAAAKPDVAPVDPLEDEVVATVMDADEDGEVAAALALLREATRESAERRRALCTPRLLAALRRVLLIPRHASARVDATAALVNLSLEPANKVRIVRAGAVPALVEVLRCSAGGGSEAREHAAGALFGLALAEENRAAIGVLGAVPPLLDLFTSPAQHPRARRDAGMAMYHLSLAAVNQTKVARFPGAPKALLAVASSAAEPTPIRRLALMVVCNVGGCAEGRAALMDAGAVASVSGILLSGNDDTSTRVAELEEWCVAAIYALSRGSLRFRGLARAAGADRALRRVAEEGTPGGVRREMARKTLRAMRGDLDEEADLTGSSLECGDGGGEDCGGSIVSDGLMSFRRRQRDVGAASGGNTAEF
ncbi:U-box domain-containing protein 40-like [Lolium rigidum]|uniref:U-box domain-containing protein 40-like n=1 Tax=Lolium rigidum TaxID=89674 RepID=UPI001F5CDEB4|nr:U-box domain-containing protein 40-like [Lolium rigidum]